MNDVDDVDDENLRCIVVGLVNKEDERAFTFDDMKVHCSTEEICVLDLLWIFIWNVCRFW